MFWFINLFIIFKTMKIGHVKGHRQRFVDNKIHYTSSLLHVSEINKRYPTWTEPWRKKKPTERNQPQFWIMAVVDNKQWTNYFIYLLNCLQTKLVEKQCSPTENENNQITCWSCWFQLFKWIITVSSRYLLLDQQHWSFSWSRLVRGEAALEPKRSQFWLNMFVRLS